MSKKNEEIAGENLAFIAISAATTRDDISVLTLGAAEIATRAAIDPLALKEVRPATLSANFNAIHMFSNANDSAIYEAVEKATHMATFLATRKATYTRTEEATDKVIGDSTCSEIWDISHSIGGFQVRESIVAAPREAADDATSSATIDDIHDASFAATRSATRAATENDAYVDAHKETIPAILYTGGVLPSDASHEAVLDASDAADPLIRDRTYHTMQTATYHATRDATDFDTYDKVFNATNEAIDDATDAVMDITWSANI